MGPPQSEALQVCRGLHRDLKLSAGTNLLSRFKSAELRGTPLSVANRVCNWAIAAVGGVRERVSLPISVVPVLSAEASRGRCPLLVKNDATTTAVRLIPFAISTARGAAKNAESGTPLQASPRVDQGSVE
jgi:hypothetical protein